MRLRLDTIRTSRGSMPVETIARPQTDEKTNDVKVSIIVATYRSGSGLDRVVTSLDGQTMPQDEFEVIFVDDGSPDDTAERLRALAATRPNVSVYRIPNSGWPSRPRNVGIERARGEYLVFMDHDDSLYPDGLRSAYEYAKSTGADILSPKEAKTNDSWWQMTPPFDANIPNALEELGTVRLMPLIPHKLYARHLFTDHGVRFPEGSRVLWEDIFINVDALRHSRVVAIAADSPFYLWHASDTNSSHTFDPARKDFWDRLADMMAYIDEQLAGPEHEAARRYLMSIQMEVRVIDRTLRLMWTHENSRRAKRAFSRARELARRYATPDVVAAMSPKHAAQLHLLLAGRPDLMRAFHGADLDLTASVTSEFLTWDDGVLRATVNGRMRTKADRTPGFVLRGDRVVRNVDRDVADLLPAELLDYTDRLDALTCQVVARGRESYIAWNVPLQHVWSGFEDAGNGGLDVLWTGEGSLDLRTGALGRPIDTDVFDFRARFDFCGMVRKGGLGSPDRVLPALVDGRPAVAYRSATKDLALDLTQAKRTFATDARPRRALAGDAHAFRVPLDNIAVSGEGTLTETFLEAIPTRYGSPPADPEAELRAQKDRGEHFTATVVASAGSAELTGSLRLPAGTYRLHARREGKLNPTQRSLVVGEGGAVAFV
jgi:glycosyltransferase involved in cell wall biosynthesis